MNSPQKNKSRKMDPRRDARPSQNKPETVRRRKGSRTSPEQPTPKQGSGKIVTSRAPKSPTAPQPWSWRRSCAAPFDSDLEGGSRLSVANPLWHVHSGGRSGAGPPGAEQHRKVHSINVAIVVEVGGASCAWPPTAEHLGQIFRADRARPVNVARARELAHERDLEGLHGCHAFARTPVIEQCSQIVGIDVPVHIGIEACAGGIDRPPADEHEGQVELDDIVAIVNICRAVAALRQERRNRRVALHEDRQVSGDGQSLGNRELSNEHLPVGVHG